MKDVWGIPLKVGDYVEIIMQEKRPIAVVQRPRVNLCYGVRVELIRVDRPGVCYYPGNELLKKEPEDLI